jgi:hypothetical protein
VYIPEFSAGIAHVPSADETAVETALVALFFASTVAPGMTAPDPSTTTPDKDAVVPPWAHAAALKTTLINIAASETRNNL